MEHFSTDHAVALVPWACLLQDKLWGLNLGLFFFFFATEILWDERVLITCPFNFFLYSLFSEFKTKCYQCPQCPHCFKNETVDIQRSTNSISPLFLIYRLFWGVRKICLLLSYMASSNIEKLFFFKGKKSCKTSRNM